MRRLLPHLTVAALVFALTGVANAHQGKNSGSRSPSFSSKSFSKSSSQHFYKNDFHYSKQWWCSRFGCYCYWRPFDSCWYVWYGPWFQYIPYTEYVTLVAPVATPVPAPIATPAPGQVVPTPPDGPPPGP